MRKSRFLLNLIAATAIGLSVFGCDSSSSGAVGDVTDLTTGQNSNNVQIINERQSLRQYLVVGERGADSFAPSFAAGQSAPADAANTIASPGDGVVDDRRAALWEMLGIAEQPRPNSNIVGPGTTDTTAPQVPTVSATAGNAGTTGYHAVTVDPTGRFAVLASRGRNRGVAADDTTVTAGQMQIFGLGPEAAFDVVFPPVFQFQNVAAPAPILGFNSVNQGEFLSVKFSPDARHLYVAADQQIVSLSIDGNTGGLTGVDVDAFPAGAANLGTLPALGGANINNAAQLIFTRDGTVMFAIDNANNQIIPFTRDVTTGQLTQGAAVATVVDPRGATIDRSGQFLYIVGRDSQSLAGYQIGANGALTQIQVFNGFGAIAVPLGGALGDVDANPVLDQLFVSTFAGVTQGYSINTTTGLLTATGAPTTLLGTSRNVGNIEVDPTGQFVLVCAEADLESVSSFANVVTGANGAGQPILAAGPTNDTNGRIIFALANTNQFAGSLSILRINGDGSVSVERQVDAANPHGLDFFQRVIQAPAGAATTTTTTTGGTP